MISRQKILDFPDLDHRLLEIFSNSPVKNILALHIETTGFSRDNSVVFLAGCLQTDQGQGKWLLKQWLLDDLSAEKELLGALAEEIRQKNCLLHYNGLQFDLPFLEKRCARWEAPVSWRNCGQLDLYRVLRPCQKLLGLEHMRLSDLEKFLGVPRADGPSGKEYISLFKKYIADGHPDLEEILLECNRQNLCGLLRVSGALAYPSFLQGDFRLEQSQIAQDALLCSLRLPAALPRPFSLDCRPKPWAISGFGRQAQIAFPLENGCLRMYYPNYKDYCYLPAEDVAIHKSVGAYVDKKNRMPATKENCFTRFPCTVDFMQSDGQIEDYIRRCLKL